MRPLPWLLFLPALVALRCSRTFVSLLALMVGYPSVDPADVVSFLQKLRREVRAVKYQGQRNIRHRRQNTTLAYMMNNGKSNGEGGVVQELLASLVRGICYQKPEVLISLRDMLKDARKLKKSSVRFDLVPEKIACATDNALLRS